MIFTDLSEGLGNQMFQYAFSRYLQYRYNENIYLDTKSYTRNKGERSFSLENYKLNQMVKYGGSVKETINDIFIKSYRKYLTSIPKIDLYNTDEIAKLEKKGLYISSNVYAYVDYAYNVEKCNKYVLGTWQNVKYFNQIRTVLVNEFQLIKSLDKENLEYLRQIRNSNSVCIHIRLGDYLSPQWSFLNVCTQKYYFDAYNYLKEKLVNPVFYIFSNTTKDLEWIKQNYVFLRECNFVDLSNSDYADLELMKNCKHFIISNSTYSWWAQYLSEDKNKLVVAPSLWYKDGKNDEKLGVHIPEWTIIDV